MSRGCRKAAVLGSPAGGRGAGRAASVLPAAVPRAETGACPGQLCCLAGAWAPRICPSHLAGCPGGVLMLTVGGRGGGSG